MMSDVEHLFMFIFHLCIIFGEMSIQMKKFGYFLTDF